MSISAEISNGIKVFRDNLRNIGELYSECETESGFIQKTLETAGHIPGLNYASYFKLDASDFSFRSVNSINKTNADVEKAFQILTEEKIIPQVLAQKNSLFHKLSEENNVFVLPIAQKEGLHGIAVVSLRDDEVLRSVELELTLLFQFLSEKLKGLIIEEALKSADHDRDEAISTVTEQFSESSRTLKMIIDLIPVGILLIDEFDGSIADANNKALELIRTNKNVLIGRKREQYFMTEKKVNNDNSGIAESETLLKCEDGRVLPVSTATSKIHIGNQQFILRSFADISERKRMEDALLRAHFELEQKVEDRTIQLKKTNKKLKKEIKKKNKAQAENKKLLLSVENSPVGVLITDSEGEIQYANPCFLEQTGYEFEEINGISPQIFISEENRFDFNSGLLLPLRSERRVEKEVVTRRKNGEKFWATIYGASIVNKKDKITHFTLVQEDISRKKVEEQKLLIAKMKAQESERFKSHLLNNITHEFRTPLTSVLGFSDVMYQQTECENMKSLANIIHESGERLLYTLNNIFYYSEFESNSIRVSSEQTDLVEATRESVGRLQRWAESKNLKHSINLPGSELTAGIDKIYFVECIERLFDNAVKFTDAGEISVNYYPEKSEGKNWAVVEVSDTGVGMGDSDQANIFKPFRQESEGFSRKYDGLGLSLVVVNKFIEQMGGSISLESEPNRGTTFRIRLPQTN